MEKKDYQLEYNITPFRVSRPPSSSDIFFDFNGFRNFELLSITVASMICPCHFRKGRTCRTFALVSWTGIQKDSNFRQKATLYTQRYDCDTLVAYFTTNYWLSISFNFGFFVNLQTSFKPAAPVTFFLVKRCNTFAP